MRCLLSSDDRLQFEVADLKETAKVAAVVASALLPGMLVGLSGPLGAGKTEFVRGVGAALGFAEQVVSPTFVLETIYSASVKGNGISAVHHWDLYRLGVGFDPVELIEERWGLDSVVFVEWPERIAGLAERLDVVIHIEFLNSSVGSEQGCRRIGIRGADVVKRVAERTESSGRGN